MVYGSIYESSRVEGSFLPDYAGPDGSFMMVSEALETDQAMFNIVIEHDFLEAAACNDVQLEATLQAIDEGFVGDMWAKIVELLKKIKDKIVSIAKAAAVKIQAFFTKDNKILVNRYEKQFSAARLDKIEVKDFCKKKAEIASKANIDYLVDRFKKVCGATDKTEVETTLKECTAEKALGATLGEGRTSSPSSYTKDYRNSVFESGKTYKASEISGIIKPVLTNYGDSIKAVEAAKRELTVSIDESKKTAESMNTEANKPYDVNNEDIRKKKEIEQSKASAAKSIATMEEQVAGKIFGAIMDALKFDMKQCRKAFIYIASKGAGAVKEDADLLTEAEMDLQDYEVDSFFEQYSYDEEELSA